MLTIDQIAFFWVGNDNLIPTNLVKSINLVYKNRVKIFHLTDYNTKKINGVSKTIRFDLSKDIMLARLKAYRDFPYNKKLTYFCDADCLFIQKLNLFDLKNDMYLIKRSTNESFTMNHLWPEYYPEFEKRNSKEVMPYLFGGMAFRNGKNFFTELLNICLRLPVRFHRWYGDQYSLMINVKENNHKINLLPIDVYLKIVRQALTVKDFKIIFNSNIKIITFKGKESKKFIQESFSNLTHFYENIGE